MDQNGYPSTQELKVVLRASATLARCGLARVPVQDAARQIRAKRIQETGIRRYLYDLLGGRANWPLRQCTLLRDGLKVVVPGEWQGQKLVDFLTGFAPEELPDCIQIKEGEQRISLHI